MKSLAADLIDWASANRWHVVAAALVITLAALSSGAL